MKKFASALIIMALFLSGTVLAADKTPAASGVENARHHKTGKRRMKFEDCDKHNTGALTFAEARECFPRMTKDKFDAIDANKDGKITREELKAHGAARAGKRHQKFEDCDKNNVGALTFTEAQECFPRMTREKFDAIDANKDGKITRDEIKARKAGKKKSRATGQQ